MKFNKLIAAFIAGSLILCQTIYAQKQTTDTNQETKEMQKINFTDIKDDYWARESIQKISNAGIIKGYPDGTFKPEEPVTRAEFVRIVNGVMGYEESVSQSSFKDVKKDGWYYSSLLIAEKYGYIRGFEDNTFRPNEKITKEQVCVIVTKITDIKQLSEVKMPKDQISNWSKPYVMTVLSNRLMALDEKGNFYPKQYATRALVADVLSKFLVEQKEAKKDETKKDEIKKDEIKKEDKNKEQIPNTSSGGGGSSSSSGGSTPSETEQEKTIRQSKEVVQALNENLEFFNTEAEKEIVRDIISNMESYIADQNYDYKSAVEKVKEKYSKLSQEEQKDLKYKIQLYNNTENLLNLKDKLL